MVLRLYAGDKLSGEGGRVLCRVQPVEQCVVAEPGQLVGAQPARLGLHVCHHLQLRNGIGSQSKCLNELRLYGKAAMAGRESCRHALLHQCTHIRVNEGRRHPPLAVGSMWPAWTGMRRNPVVDSFF